VLYFKPRPLGLKFLDGSLFLGSYTSIFITYSQFYIQCAISNIIIKIGGPCYLGLQLAQVLVQRGDKQTHGSGGGGGREPALMARTCYRPAALRTHQLVQLLVHLGTPFIIIISLLMSPLGHRSSFGLHMRRTGHNHAGPVRISGC
jgi:hypothetical protein